MHYLSFRAKSGIKSYKLFEVASGDTNPSFSPRSGIGHVVDSYLAKCGLKSSDIERSLSPHSLRHTAGTLSLQNGSSLREVQDFLGHSDPKTTAVYTHVLNSWENNPASKIEIDL